MFWSQCLCFFWTLAWFLGNSVANLPEHPRPTSLGLGWKNHWAIRHKRSKGPRVMRISRAPCQSFMPHLGRTNLLPGPSFSKVCPQKVLKIWAIFGPLLCNPFDRGHNPSQHTLCSTDFYDSLISKTLQCTDYSCKCFFRLHLTVTYKNR